jgi:hypothetical protein
MIWKRLLIAGLASLGLLTGAAAQTDPPKMAMGMNLSEVVDWSVQQPFIDVFKTARTWIGHKPRQWGGVTATELEAAGYLDENGWPLEIPPELGSIGTLILTDLPEDAGVYAGRYRLRFDGDGIVEVGGRARNVRYGDNEVQFDFTPGPGPVDIRIQRTDRRRSGDHVRNISVVRLDHAAAYDAGAMFNPAWLDRLHGFTELRFMDWMITNAGDVPGTWDKRPKPSDYSFTRSGVPAEVMIELANRTGANPWFTMPHLADDDYFRSFATLVRDTLWIEQKAYVELSNEVWNWQFPQAEWAGKAALERWGNRDAWVQYYALRATEMAQIWTEVFGDTARERLVRVIATQTGWLGLERDILKAPLWMAEDDGATRKPPHAYFDAYAITGYFGFPLGLESRQPMVRGWIGQSLALATKAADERGLTGTARAGWIAAHRFDTAVAQAAAELRDGAASDDADGSLSDLLTRMLPHHVAVAGEFGLDLIMYEGGTHVVGLGPVTGDDEVTAFFNRLNYSAEMGALYTELIAGWAQGGGGPFLHYSDVQKPTRWGSWGALRHLGDDNPRWDALVAAQ